MNNLQIHPLDIDNDVMEISSWDKKYKDDPRFETIRKYVLEDDAFWNLYELIEINYEKFEIGENEKKIGLVIKNSQEKIIGFMLGIITDMKTKSPELIIQYLTIHPEFQGQGVGSYFLREITTNPKKYIGIKTKKYFTRIDETNIPSKKTFEKFGFNFSTPHSGFLVAKLNTEENFKE